MTQKTKYYVPVRMVMYARLTRDTLWYSLFGIGFEPRSHFIVFKWMEHDLLGERSPVAAVAFKYLKKVKHRSDILKGLNIMQPAKKKKWGHTKKCCRFKKKLFQPTVVRWPNLHNFKAWNRNKLTSNVYSWQSFTCLHIKCLDIDNPLAFEVSKLKPVP